MVIPWMSWLVAIKENDNIFIEWNESKDKYWYCLFADEYNMPLKDGSLLFDTRYSIIKHDASFNMKEIIW